MHLGPAADLDRHALSIAKSDTLDVSGSKLTSSGQSMLVAQGVKKSEKSVAVRDADGISAWAPRGRR